MDQLKPYRRTYDVCERLDVNGTDILLKESVAQPMANIRSNPENFIFILFIFAGAVSATRSSFYLLKSNEM